MAQDNFHVKPGSREWTLRSAPGKRLQVSKTAMDLLQAENALLHDVLRAARGVADIHFWHGEAMGALRTSLARYDGWTEDPEVRADLVEKLLAIVDDLQDGGDRPSP